MRNSLILTTAALLALLGSTKLAHAQSAAGVTQKPLPNVMLLVDTSGSMERMNDNTLPVCVPGTASNPNRWGTLVQSLTGNLQPYFSCGTMDRAPNGALANEYRIGGVAPYDVGYAL